MKYEWQHKNRNNKNKNKKAHSIMVGDMPKVWYLYAKNARNENKTKPTVKAIGILMTKTKMEIIIIKIRRTFSDGRWYA